MTSLKNSSTEGHVEMKITDLKNQIQLEQSDVHMIMEAGEELEKEPENIALMYFEDDFGGGKANRDSKGNK